MTANEPRSPHSIDFNQLKVGDHIHMIGICGTAMGSLAGILKGMGFHVTGSDQNVYPPMSTQLKNLGIEIKQGYKKENLNPRPDLVIVGNVIQRVFEETQALLVSDIPYTSLPEAMGEFVIADKKSVVVAGTHGKTTTTSMMAWIAEVNQHKPGFLIGGIPKNFGQSFQVPEKDLFVIEGDEYDTAFFAKVPKFIYYKPKFVVLTGIEFDHADIYSSMKEVSAAFKELIQRIPADGVLVANADSEEVEKLLPLCQGKVLTYGFKKGQYQARNISFNKGQTTFDICKTESGSDQKVETLKIQVYGDYNISNAMSAYLLSREMGWRIEGCLEALQNFKGVKRRQEIIGTPNNITVIEDFAHHPTAVGMTISSIQKCFEGQRVFSVFEPRSAASRRKVFERAYIEALSQGQNVVVARPYDQSRIPEEDRFSAENVVDELRSRNVNAHYKDSSEEIVNYLSSEARPEDVILIMSNGGFDGLYSKLLNSLNKE